MFVQHMIYTIRSIHAIDHISSNSMNTNGDSERWFVAVAICVC